MKAVLLNLLSALVLLGTAQVVQKPSPASTIFGSCGSITSICYLQAQVVQKPSPASNCCGTENNGNVVVRNGSSSVVYKRVAVQAEYYQSTSATTVELAGSSLNACARAAARAGLTAFEFNGKCSAYKFRLSLHKRSKGGKTIYATEENFPVDKTLELLDQIPYTQGDIAGSRVYMLSNFTVDSAGLGLGPTFPTIFKNSSHREQFITIGYDLVSINENQEINIFYNQLDVPTCLSKSGTGYPTILSSFYFDAIMTPVYFIKECGNTVQLPDIFSKDVFKSAPQLMPIYSHPGFGCVDYPSETHVNCTVTFKRTSPYLMMLWYFPFQDKAKTCDGFRLTSWNSNTGKNVVADLCSSGLVGNNITEATITLQGSSTKRRDGFYIAVSDAY